MGRARHNLFFCLLQFSLRWTSQHSKTSWSKYARYLAQDLLRQLRIRCKMPLLIFAQNFPWIRNLNSSALTTKYQNYTVACAQIQPTNSASSTIDLHWLAQRPVEETYLNWSSKECILQRTLKSELGEHRSHFKIIQNYRNKFPIPTCSE